MFRTYQSALDYLHGFDDPYLKAVKNAETGTQSWGLDPIREVLSLLGNPQDRYPIIHIAGTKGKGSTAALVAQGCIEAGLKTGLTVSPHLQDWRERIQIDREPIPPQVLIDLVESFKPIADKCRAALTAFEVSIALALWYFHKAGCRIAIVETGLGGRLDATNIVNPLVCALTSISLDHTKLLGNTVQEIAWDKSHIIKGSPVVSAPQQPAALSEIVKRVEAVGARLVLVGRDITLSNSRLDWEGGEVIIQFEGQHYPISIGLAGHFQIENAAVAFGVLKELQRQGMPISDSSIAQGLKETKWNGRLERVRKSPLLVIDSAHNDYSVAVLIESLQLLYSQPVRWVVVFGCMGDKQYHSMLARLLRISAHLVLTQAATERAASVERLERAVRFRLHHRRRHRPVEVHTARRVGDAIEVAKSLSSDDHPILITGSLALAGEARSYLLQQK